MDLIRFNTDSYFTSPSLWVWTTKSSGEMTLSSAMVQPPSWNVLEYAGSLVLTWTETIPADIRGGVSL